MRRITLSLISLLLACGPDTVTADGGSAGSTSDDGTTAASPSASTSASAGTSTSTDGADETSPTSAAFVDDPDLGQGSSCEMLAQDCPAGLKCMPYAASGGSSWDTTRCFPVVEDPAQPGEPCTVEGSNVSGIDTCAIGSMCFYVDHDTLEGICVEFCLGDYVSPYCEDPGTHCVVFSDGLPTVCLPTCHPLEDDCPEGQSCYSALDSFECYPEVSRETGAIGEACEHLNGCDPTTFCAAAESVPECAGSIGCCSSFCTIGDDSACLPGQTCQPWFEPGTAPTGFDELGACALP
ncbi:MAG: ribulose phosphate epimerase [Myxococcales bacterium]|nr:ribulose phosphate epimerase [Myxococcales bacterium]MCB9714144.1 ribulose phosphate epimerase [Myxococcales bacterium]